MFHVHFVHFDNTLKERKKERKIGIQIGITIPRNGAYNASIVTYNDAKRSRDSRIYSQVIIEWIPSDIQRHIIERHNHVKISSYLYNTFPSSQNQSQVNPKNFESMNPKSRDLHSP